MSNVEFILKLQKKYFFVMRNVQCRRESYQGNWGHLNKISCKDKNLYKSHKLSIKIQLPKMVIALSVIQNYYIDWNNMEAALLDAENEEARYDAYVVAKIYLKDN